MSAVAGSPAAMPPGSLAPASGRARGAWRDRLTVGAAALVLGAIFFFADHDLNGFTMWRDGSLDAIEALGAAVAEGDRARQLALLALGALGLTGIALRPPARGGPDPWLGGIAAAFVGWCYLSLLWADSPALVGRRLLVLTMYLLGAAGMLRLLSFRQTVATLALMILGYLALGLAVELAAGAFTPWLADYRFAGTLHPNYQATNCALLLLCGCWLAGTAPKRPWPGLLLMALGAAFLLLTRSRTALAAGAVATFVFWLVVMPPSRRGAALFAGAWLVGLVAWVASVDPDLSPFQALLLGRADSELSSFTGRTPIWAICLSFVRESPLLGQGYHGFWTDAHTIMVSEAADWTISEAHSAYIEALLSLGAVGLALYALLLATALGRGLRLARRDPDRRWAWVSAVLAYAVVNGCLESAAFGQNMLQLVLMLSIGRLLAREAGGAHAGRPKSEGAKR